jgi:hypothetical protein
MSFQQAPINTELAPKASQEPRCSKPTQGVIVRETTPTPQKMKKTKKNAISKQLTSD